MFLISKVPSHIIASQAVPVIAKSLVFADYVFCLAGVGTSMISIIKREKPTALKIIGATLNLITFVFLMGLLCFWLLH